MKTLPLSGMGNNLKLLRKDAFPNDCITTFAFRVNVSKNTYIKMEKGDLSVSMSAYYRAAQLLRVADQFAALFEMPTKGLLEEVGL